jgi:hypothetical protein
MERSCSGRTETSLRIQILQLSRSRSGDAQAPSQVSPHHTSFLHLFIQPTLSFTPHTNLPLRYSSKNLSFGAGRLSSSEVGRLVEHMLTTDYLRLYCELKTFIPSFIPNRKGYCCPAKGFYTAHSSESLHTSNPIIPPIRS